MPKLKNVTAAELKEAIEASEDAGAAVASIASRIQQGYVDELPQPVQSARSFLAAGVALCELAQSLIIRAAMQEQRAELETMLRAQQAGEDKGK